MGSVSASLLRHLARKKHIDAVRLLDGDDLDAFFACLREVDALEEDARRAERIAMDQELVERRLTAQALEQILDRARKTHARGTR